MPELNKDLAKTIETLINKSYDLFDKENIKPSLELLEKAWDLLPSPKESWQESYYISQDIIHSYLQAGDLEKAIAYLPTFMRCDNKNRNYGESEFLAGKIALDRGKETEALDYFVVAGHKGGARIFNGSENKKYKDFYKNHSNTAAKVKAYKESLKPKKLTLTVESLKESDYPVFRHLEHPELGKVCNIAYQDKEVFIELGKIGKTKVKGKTFLSENKAIEHWKKKEVEWLKKGYIYKNEYAKPGMATLHRFIGTGYTGALSFEPTPKGIYVSKVGWNNKTPRELIKDNLVLLDHSGIIIDTIDLPKALPWDMVYNTTQDLLYIYLDKLVYEYNIQEQTFTPLTKRKDLEHKRISTAGNCLAFTTKQDAKLSTQLSTAKEGKYILSIPRSNLSFALALSSDGRLLALQRKLQALDIIDTSSQKTLKTIAVDAKSIGQMEFTKDSKMIAFIDKEDYWKVRFFSLETEEELLFEEINIPTYEYAFYFAFNQDDSKLAISYRSKVKIFDFKNKTFLHEFQFEHAIKKGEIKFVGDLLGVRTDYGFFSLYKV